ncbi:MAG TPA: S53 family peptidase [Candidatus Acidoferrales bacterium]|jgi:subtilase family serine protease|nr:S53 family peptidase [Candidatus Acidoferrales bacterium]
MTIAVALTAGRVASAATPFLKVGPQVISAVPPNFTCQVVGLRPDATCYDPFQMRHAYNIDTLINAGFDGRGKTIVIVDAFQSPHIVAQLNHFNTFYALPSLNGLGGPANPSLGTFTQVAPDGLTPFDQENTDQQGWAEEISLDVEWAHAIAPGANIVLVLSKSDADIDILSATRFAVDHRLGDIISQSFGENESCVDPAILAQQHQVFAEATMKNITIFASSGDNGAAQPSCDGSAFVKAVSNPASDPLVTAVGGTELHAARYCVTITGLVTCNPAANPAPGTYEGEIAWNEPDFGSTGGGFSVLFDNPPFQDGAIDGGKKQRGVPDVSYSAAVLHGVLTWLDIPGVTPGSFFLFGGTSAGSPQWAAIAAIADQKAGYSLGYLNTALYQIGQSGGKSRVSLFDVTSGNNSLIDNSTGVNVTVVQGFNAGPGWDATTGLGSPQTDQLVSFLIDIVSPNDGPDAIKNSAPHSDDGKSGPGSGRMKPHVQ